MSGTEGVARVSGRPADGEPLLLRAFRILESFKAPGEAVGLALLAHRTRMPKSSVLRIANQLVELGALERGDDGRFVVGLRLLEIATMAPRGHGLRSAALPYMEDLHRVTNQHVQLAVREGAEAVLIERLSARGAIDVAHRVGGRLPLDKTGVGVALLALAPDEVFVEAIKSRSPAHQRRVRQLVALARRDGVVAVTATNPVETGPAEVTTIAAPIIGSTGESVGALSVVQPGGRSGVSGLKVALRTAALGIARSVESL